MQYNTVVSGAMKLLNALESFKGNGDASAVVGEAYSIPCACSIPPVRTSPTCCGRTSATRRRSATCLDAPWPAVEESALARDEVELVLQVNGKLRGALKVAATASREEIEAAALASPEVERLPRVGRSGA